MKKDTTTTKIIIEIQESAGGLGLEILFEPAVLNRKDPSRKETVKILDEIKDTIDGYMIKLQSEKGGTVEHSINNKEVDLLGGSES